MLFDRQSLSISLGTINDQFVRSMITMLGEIWAGFGVIRPSAFCKMHADVIDAEQGGFRILTLSPASRFHHGYGPWPEGVTAATTAVRDSVSTHIVCIL